MSRVVGTFESVAAELTRMGPQTVNRGRGATAQVLDAAANEAANHARSLWTGGSGESASKISARMSRDRSRLSGYLIGDGRGGFFQEIGTGHHPPQPVLGPAIERASGDAARAIADVAGRL
jgi:hypothetical protein